jgi:hypothetical protein
VSTLLKEYTYEDIQATIARNATFAIQITRMLAAQLEENAPALVFLPWLLLGYRILVHIVLRKGL